MTVSSSSSNNNNNNNNNNAVRKQQRPLSTYTSLGSPIGQMRKMSIVGGNGNSIPSIPNASSPSFQRPRSSSLHIPSKSTSLNDSEYKLGELHHAKRKFLESCVSGINRDSGSWSDLSDHHHRHHRHNAIEVALESERKRIEESEKQEQSMTIDELRDALKKERERTCRIQSELASLRYTNSHLMPHQHDHHSLQFSHQKDEVLEEEHINGLVQHLDLLQEEKFRIMNELEREEEMLKTLYPKLDEVRRQKRTLESQLESEADHYLEKFGNSSTTTGSNV